MRCTLLMMMMILAACRPEIGPPPHAARWSEGVHPLGSIEELQGSVANLEAADCGFPVHVQSILPDPVRVPDRHGEWVEIIHYEVELLDLRGWTLRSGGRERTLYSAPLAAGERFRVGGGLRSLGPIRLRNRGGLVHLIDPCGLEISRLGWGPDHGAQLRPGERVTRDPRPALNEKAPPENSQAGLHQWLQMDLNHRPNDYESFALTPELRSRWVEHLASRSLDRQPRTLKPPG